MKFTKNYLKSKKTPKQGSSSPTLSMTASGVVYVGMSGGVDSSVSAYLLKKQGYTVIGAFIKTWSPDWMPCPWREERRDAIRVAAHIGIPLLTLDLSEEYKRGVADYMIAEYKAGRTPNPDVMCNRTIKFGAFYEWARAQGAEYVATGHYSRVRQKTKGKGQKFNPGLHSTFYELRTGVDSAKDQSYFLWMLRQEQLPHILFPVGDLKKEKVREIAREAKLPVALKKDSQGLCFLGPVDMKQFLKHYIETKPGKVLDEKGNVIGTHEGAVFYTLGEHYMGYVVARDLGKNIITVSQKRSEEVAGKTKLELNDTNWIPAIPDAKKKYMARTRYRQQLQSVRLNVKGHMSRVQFEQPQIVDAGQSIVLYDGDVCLGGGIVNGL